MLFYFVLVCVCITHQIWCAPRECMDAVGLRTFGFDCLQNEGVVGVYEIGMGSANSLHCAAPETISSTQ